MPPKSPIQDSNDRISQRFECEFDLGQNISIETAALCLGLSEVIRRLALDLNSEDFKRRSTAAAIEKLEEAHTLLLDRIRAI